MWLLNMEGRRFGLPLVTVAAMVAGQLGCVGEFGQPVNEYKNAGEARFAVASVDYSSGGGELLDSADATWIRAGLEGLGLTLRSYEAQAMVSDLVFEMRNYLEVLYVTGHGSSRGLLMHGLTLTPKGIYVGGLTPEEKDASPEDLEPLEVNARFLILATCNSGKADWVSAFGYRTEGIFAYRNVVNDIEDNRVSQAYVRCLDGILTARGDQAPRPKGRPAWTAADHHECWARANNDAGEPFASGWISFVRDPEDRFIRVYAAEGLLSTVEAPSG
jgi:hypothetical protein